MGLYVQLQVCIAQKIVCLCFYANTTHCALDCQCRGSDLSNCIRADVIRDMLNVVEFGRHDSMPTAGLNVHEAQELMHDLCSD